MSGLEETMENTVTNTNGNLDLISNLPSRIINGILIRLPVHEAARTSILSRQWRVYWAKLPHLDLGYQFYRTIIENVKYHGPGCNIYYEHERIIQKILILHLGTNVEVTLYIPTLDPSGLLPFLNIDNSILLQLSRKKINLLTLTYEGNEPHSLPRYLFSFLDLTDLDLCNVVFAPPHNFKGFPNLISLKFMHTRFSLMDNVFENLIVGSPLLKKLIFMDCMGISHFKVAAPNLKTLQLRDEGQLKTICLENVPKLADVTISTVDTRVDHSEKSSSLLGFLTSLPNVTRLSVNGNFLKYLAADSLPQELPTTIEGLKYLKLKDLDFAIFDEISCALCLIRNTPNLKELEIQASTSRYPPPPKWGYMEPEAPFVRTLDSLRVVEIELIAGLRPELELIQFLLANSPFLEKMYVDAVYKIDTEVALDMAIELIRYFRASARVDFRYLTERDIWAH